ncbi:MAG: hypothetical protein ACXWF8_14245 [Methylobacter sp.]
MKELKFSEISLDDFAKIYAEMHDLVRKDLEGETFYSGKHSVFGEITLYQPQNGSKAIMLQHQKPICETPFDVREFDISLIA